MGYENIFCELFYIISIFGISFILLLLEIYFYHIVYKDAIFRSTILSLSFQ